MWHFTNLPDFRRQMFENEAIWIVCDLSLFMTWKKSKQCNKHCPDKISIRNFVHEYFEERDLQPRHSTDIISLCP